MSLLTVLALQQLLQLDEDWDHDLDQVLHDLGHHPPFGHQDPPPLPASSSISEFSDKMLRWMYIAFSDKMLRWMCISLQAGIYRDPVDKKKIKSSQLCKNSSIESHLAILII